MYATVMTLLYETAYRLIYTGLQSERVFGELEDAHKPNDSQKSERCAGLEVVCGAAASRRQHVKQRHVVRDQCRRVNQSLEVATERRLRRTRHEPDEEFECEPGVTEGLDDEERARPVRLAVGKTVGLGEARQCLQTQQDDGDQGHCD